MRIDGEVVAEEPGRIPATLELSQTREVRGREGSRDDLGAGVGLEAQVHALRAIAYSRPPRLGVGRASADGGDAEVRVAPRVGRGIRRRSQIGRASCRERVCQYV